MSLLTALFACMATLSERKRRPIEFKLGTYSGIVTELRPGKPANSSQPTEHRFRIQLSPVAVAQCSTRDAILYEKLDFTDFFDTPEARKILRSGSLKQRDELRELILNALREQHPELNWHDVRFADYYTVTVLDRSQLPTFHPSYRPSEQE